MGLHGAQVGVASVVAAAAWELLLERLAAGPAQLDADALDEARARTRVSEAFGHLDDDGGIAAECWSDYARKLAACGRQRERIEDVLQHWADHRPEVVSLVRPAAEIGGGLRAAGAAARFGELEPQVPDDLARWAVQNCALMRNRFTVVDLLTLLGWWTADDVAEVLHRAATATEAPTAPGGRP
jgi:glycerol-1-phosphate dehydrogenase [NAD(P)+]